MLRNIIEKYKRKKIFRSMFVACFSLAAICALVASVFGYCWFTKVQIDDAKQKNGNMLYATSLMVDNYVQSIGDTMETLRNDIYIKKKLANPSFFWDRDMNIAAQQIVNTMMVNTMFHSIYVVKEGDYIIKCTNPSYPLNQQADDMMIEAFYQSEFKKFAVKYYLDIYGKSQSLLMLTDGTQDLVTGQKENGIIISIDIGKVVESVLPVMQEGEQYLLVNPDGGVVYTKGGKYVNGGEVQYELVEMLNSGKPQKTEILSLDNERFLISQVGIGEEEFYLIHLLPFKYIGTTINHLLITFMLIGVFVVILILLVAYAMANWVYYPIEAVIHTTNATGEIPENMTDRLSQTELASIASTYHTMVQKLNNFHMQKEQEELSIYLRSKEADNKVPEWVEETYGKEGVLSQVLCLRICDMKGLHESNTKDAINFEIQTMINVVEQTLKAFGDVLVNPVDREYIAVMLFLENRIDRNVLEAKLKEIFNVIQELLHIGLNAGISVEKEGFGELAFMYQMARAATAYCFLYGVNTIVTEEEMVRRALGSKNSIDIEELMHWLKTGNKENFHKELLQIMNQLKEGSIQSAKENILNIAAEILKYHNSLNYNFTALSGIDYENLSNELAQFEYMNDVVEWFLKMVDEIEVIQMKARLCCREDIVDKALNYLKSNYSNANISAQYIADMYGITPSYFSRLFNERCGYSFPDYLAALRMENAAKLLLEDNNKSVQEICGMVGYTNSSYFTASFKKNMVLHRENSEKFIIKVKKINNFTKI